MSPLRGWFRPAVEDLWGVRFQGPGARAPWLLTAAASRLKGRSPRRLDNSPPLPAGEVISGLTRRVRPPELTLCRCGLNSPWRQGYDTSIAARLSLSQVAANRLEIVVEFGGVLLAVLPDLFDDGVVPHEVNPPSVVRECK